MELGRQDERTLQVVGARNAEKRKKSIQKNAMSLFLEKTGNDMENIANELEKLLSYTYGKDAIESADVEEICTVTTESASLI